MASLAGGVVCWMRSMAVATYSSLPKKMSGAGGGLVDRSALLKQPISVNNSTIKSERDILQVVKLATMTTIAYSEMRWRTISTRKAELTRINVGVVYLIPSYSIEGAAADMNAR
jgi:hypothetical protein